MCAGVLVIGNFPQYHNIHTIKKKCDVSVQTDVLESFPFKQMDWDPILLIGGVSCSRNASNDEFFRIIDFTTATFNEIGRLTRLGPPYVVVLKSDDATTV
ncbi:hypothetical protein V3C99_007608 [Haemonchus contortus]